LERLVVTLSEREREKEREVCVRESKRVKSERYVWPGVEWETFRISRQNEQDKRNRTNSVRARVKTNRTRINKTTDPFVPDERNNGE
jgi:hypothetical protein